MNLNIIDIIIILFILLGGLVGFKEGVIKKTVSILGLIMVIVISFILKNHLSVFFYENLPFFNLWGIFKGIQTLNILFYEMLAFLIISSVLMLVYKVIVGITGIFEKILKATIILSIPSKILGFFVGLIESYIWVYIFLFILTLPFFNIKDIDESKISNHILANTPIISKYTEKTLDISKNIYNIIENRDSKTNTEINEESMKLMLEYEIITKESAQKLIEKNKIDINDTSFLDQYE